MITDQHLNVEVATAAASGNAATERFATDKSPFAAVQDTPPERVDLLARSVLDAIYDTIRTHKVTYDEYNALKAWYTQRQNRPAVKAKAWNRSKSPSPVL
jgi:catechol 1,2-dioxygenase